MLVQVDLAIGQEVHTFGGEPRAMGGMPTGQLAVCFDHAMGGNARHAIRRRGHRPAHLARLARVAQQARNRAIRDDPATRNVEHDGVHLFGKRGHSSRFVLEAGEVGRLVERVF